MLWNPRKEFFLWDGERMRIKGDLIEVASFEMGFKGCHIEIRQMPEKNIPDRGTAKKGHGVRTSSGNFK